MSRYLILPILLLCLFTACTSTEDGKDDESNNTQTTDCENLVAALLQSDKSALEEILNPELENFTLLDLDNDACFHTRNLAAFVDFLNESCSELSASVLCCGCVETFPPISEVSVKIDSAGVENTRILDLITPEDGEPLIFSGIHN